MIGEHLISLLHTYMCVYGIMSSGGPAHWRCYAYVLPAQGSSRSSRNTSGSKKRPNTTRLCNHIVCELHVCFLVQTTCDPMPTVGSSRPGGAIYPNSSVIRKRDGRRHGKRDINVAIGRVYIIALPHIMHAATESTCTPHSIIRTQPPRMPYAEQAVHG